MARELWKVTIRAVHTQDVYVYADDRDSAIERASDGDEYCHGLSDLEYTLPHETWKAEPIERSTVFDAIAEVGKAVLDSYQNQEGVH